MIGPAPTCVAGPQGRCRHLFPPDLDGPKCEAFPEGIPDAIYTEGEDHTKPFDGDSGIQYEPKQ